MAKLRSVNTAIWSDSFIVDLTATEKFLFTYFLVNPFVVLTGAYEISIRQITFDTGIAADDVERMMVKFEQAGKLIYRDGWLLLFNFLKNQKLNDNMRKNVIAEMHNIPRWAQTELLKVIESNRTLAKDFEPFQSVLTEIQTLCTEKQTLRKVEVEVEVESEIEVEGESRSMNATTLPSASTQQKENHTPQVGIQDSTVTASTIVTEIFGITPNLHSQSIIEGTVTDFGLWRTILREHFAGMSEARAQDRTWRQRAIQFCLESYSKRKLAQKPVEEKPKFKAGWQMPDDSHLPPLRKEWESNGTNSNS